ncbi:DNA recombination protein RmuC [Mycoplasmatota bacterium]|nr:DNA recombination protein RmuC [Mycoplasmatota bacterium]
MLDYFIIGLNGLILILVIYLLTKVSNKNTKTQDDIDLKLYFQKEYADLRVEMTQLFGDANKVNHEDLNKFKEHMMEHINTQMKSINEKVENRLGQGFEKTNKTFNDVIERLAKIDVAQKKIESLSTEVVQLNNILTDKKSRGTFGEVQLTQILQSVMGNNKQLYELQKKMSNGTMVDALLHAPKPLGDIAVDSKFPLENYQRMVDKKLSDLERANAEKSFKQDVKKHIDAIASKYIIEDETSEQAFMFIPAEAIFAEITAYHEDVILYAQKKKVWIVSPTTLISTLTTILTVVKNIERDKQTSVILDELKKLGIEFKRYASRWDALNKSIDKLSKEAKDVSISSGKIRKKFEYIEDAKFDELEVYESIDDQSLTTKE